jgi:nucleotide-binding universal stress UspA family protein
MIGFRAVVVGVDGTGRDHDAVSWAAQEAMWRGRDLVVVHIGPEGGRHAPDPAMVVEKAALAARMAAPRLRVDTVLRPAPVGPELVRLSHDAELLVLGPPRYREGREHLLRSVVGDVIRRAAGPVAVVCASGSPAGPVMVGVDITTDLDPSLQAASAVALDVAYAEAAYRGAELSVLHAVHIPAIPPPEGLPPKLSHSHRQQTAATAVEDAVASHRRAWPGTPVHLTVLDGPAASVLAARSSEAALLVLGLRHRWSGVPHRLFGQLRHHARCPVLLVPS